jgi:hypothetical protein
MAYRIYIFVLSENYRSFKLNSMKILKIIATGLILFFACSAHAQVSVNINVGSPPAWGPAGYTEVRYYYLPDVEAYYDVESSVFIYYYGGSWVRRTYLPTRYRYYDLYGGYKVVLSDYRGDTPYVHFHKHKIQYIKGYRGKEQKTVGQRPVKANSGKQESPGSYGTNKKEKQDGNVGEKQGSNSGGDHGSKQNGQGHEGGKGKKK